MGVLGFVLPGVREIRTPLVVGWLWIALGWLTVGLLPKTWYDFPRQVVSPDWFDELGPIAKVSILSIAAYFVGIAIRPLQDGLIRVARWITIFGVLVLVLVGFAVLEPWIKLGVLVALALLTGLGVVGLVAYRLKSARVSADEIVEYLQRAVIAVALYLEERMNKLRARTRNVSAHDYYEMRRDLRLYIVEQIDVLVSNDATALRSFIHEADPGILAGVAERLIESADRSRVMEFQSGDRRGELSVELLRQAVEHLDHDLEARRAVEIFVVSELLTSRASRRDMFLAFLNLTEWEEAMLGEMDSLATELQIQAPTVYQDWDRHVSEGDFRIACSAPLGCAALAVILWSAAVNGFRWSIVTSGNRSVGRRWSAVAEVLAGAPLNFVLAGLGFGAAVIIFRSGLASRKRADSLMITCLARGVVTSASGPTSMNLSNLGWKTDRLVLSLDDPPGPDPG